MAMVKCTECGKKISDRSPACISCGNPFTAKGHPPPARKAEVTGKKVKTPDKAKKRKIMCALVSIAVLAAVCAGIYVPFMQNREKRYLARMSVLIEDMSHSVFDAERLVNLTSSVWYNTINKEDSHKTNKYTTLNGGGDVFHDDFNTSLFNLASDEKTKRTKDYLATEKRYIDDKYRELVKHPNRFDKEHRLLEELYDAYLHLYRMAIEPGGSYSAYTETKEAIVGNYYKNKNKFYILVPEQPPDNFKDRIFPKLKWGASKQIVMRNERNKHILAIAPDRVAFPINDGHALYGGDAFYTYYFDETGFYEFVITISDDTGRIDSSKYLTTLLNGYASAYGDYIHEPYAYVFMTDNVTVELSYVSDGRLQIKYSPARL